MAPLRYRPLGHHETVLLERATLGNLNWCDERFTLTDIRAQPAFAHYTRLHPERGDFGVVATLDEHTVGVVWALLLPQDDPGYGYIDAQTPEIALWVEGSFRGRGIGRSLLKALFQAAHIHQVEQLSLSVEPKNYARNLYLSEGFVPVADREDAGVMVRRTLEVASLDRVLAPR